MKRILAALARFIPARFRPAPPKPRELTATERITLKVTLEAIRNNLAAVSSISRAYQAEQNGPKIGGTLNVRRPARFEGAK